MEKKWKLQHILQGVTHRLPTLNNDWLLKIAVCIQIYKSYSEETDFKNKMLCGL